MERLIFKLSFMTSAGKTSPDLMGAPPPETSALSLSSDDGAAELTSLGTSLPGPH